MINSQSLQQIIQSLRQLPSKPDQDRLALLLVEAADVLKRLPRDKARYLKELKGIENDYNEALHIVAMFPVSGTDKKLIAAWQNTISNLLALFQTILSEFTVQISEIDMNTSIPSTQPSKRIFIVHGHDEEMKQAVARIITKLGLEPVILHEQPNRGRTIIEKFSDYSNVSFAVILLSPDDIAYPKGNAKQKRSRARQNVILELGYFVGKLGRENVFVLHREAKDFEIPSDYSGILFTLYSPTSRWEFDLVRELKACKYLVSADMLFA